MRELCPRTPASFWYLGKSFVCAASNAELSVLGFGVHAEALDGQHRFLAARFGLLPASLLLARKRKAILFFHICANKRSVIFGDFSLNSPNITDFYISSSG